MPPQDSPDVATAFRALPPDKQKEYFGRMSSEEKTKLHQSLLASPKGAIASAQPPLFSKKGLASMLYTGAEKTLTALPTVGAMAGGTIAGTAGAPTGPGDVALTGLGTFLGGAGGKAAELAGKKALFGESPTAKETLKQIAGEGALQLAYDMTGQLLKPAVRGLRSIIPAVRNIEGIPLSQSERTGSKAAGFAEHMLERSIPSAGPMQEFRNQQTQAILKRAEGLVADLSKFKGTQEERGKLIQKGLEEGNKAIADEVRSAYKGLDAITKSQRGMTTVKESAVSSLVDESGRPMNYEKAVKKPVLIGGAPVHPAQTRRVAAQLLRELKDEEKLLDPTAVDPLKKYLLNLAGSKEPTTFMGAHAARSDVMDMGRRFDDVLTTKKGRIARMMSQAIEQDMETAARAADPDSAKGILSQLKAANSLSREQHRLFEQELVKKIADTGKPEDIAAYVRKGGQEETRDLMKALSPQGRVEVGAQVMQDILGDVTKNLHPAPVGVFPQPDIIRGDAFSKAIHELGPVKGPVVLGKDGYESARRLAAITERVHPSGNDWLSLHNWIYASAIAEAPFHPEYAAMVAGGAGVMRVLAKAMTNPAALDAASRYMQAVARRSPQAIALASREFAIETRKANEDKSPRVGAILPKIEKPQTEYSGERP